VPVAVPIHQGKGGGLGQASEMLARMTQDGIGIASAMIQ